MIGPLTETLRIIKEIIRFNRLSLKERAVVFYAENRNSWVHFEPIILSLLEKHQQIICYVTSSSEDPILTKPLQGITPFFIGEGYLRNWFFHTLKASCLVMTMPDLETYFIKRSSMHTVHYLYVHHSMVSTHVIYRKGAFDSFDTIFCVGPHHFDEIRATEKFYNLKKKHLLKHGYGHLDSILVKRKKKNLEERKCDRINILVAPSWGTQALLETCGIKLIETLLKQNYGVFVRPHPETLKKSKSLIQDIVYRFSSYSNFKIEMDITSEESFFQSDFMVSDWSGVALEYAFGFERPVLFIDVPRKINNPSYKDIPSKPLEDFIRKEIGQIVSLEDIDQIGGIIKHFQMQKDIYVKRIRQARNKWVYNLGQSGQVGSNFIHKLISNLNSKNH